MVKNGVNNNITLTKVRNVLITQPRPETEKSPYFELARKFNLSLDFHPFIRVEGIPANKARENAAKYFNQ